MIVVEVCSGLLYEPSFAILNDLSDQVGWQPAHTMRVPADCAVMLDQDGKLPDSLLRISGEALLVNLVAPSGGDLTNMLGCEPSILGDQIYEQIRLP